MSATTTTNFQALWAEADAAGKAAAEACTPRPMLVGTAKGLFDDSFDESQPVYYVADGVCGFAWITFKGNTAFGRWAKAAGLARKGYPSGLAYWVRGYGQSMQKKEAYAQAFAATLRAAGVTAYAESRMD